MLVGCNSHPPPPPRYLELCREIGSKPLIGVNYFCSKKHSSFCGTLNQSIAHAVKQVSLAHRVDMVGLTPRSLARRAD